MFGLTRALDQYTGKLIEKYRDETNSKGNNKNTNYFFKTSLLRLFLEYTPIDIGPIYALHDQSELFIYTLCNELSVEKLTRISSDRDDYSMQTPLRRFVKEHTASYFAHQKDF